MKTDIDKYLDEERTRFVVAIGEAEMLLRLVLKNGSNLTPWVESRLRGALSALEEASNQGDNH